MVVKSCKTWFRIYIWTIKYIPRRLIIIRCGHRNKHTRTRTLKWLQIWIFGQKYSCCIIVPMGIMQHCCWIFFIHRLSSYHRFMSASVPFILLLSFGMLEFYVYFIYLIKWLQFALEKSKSEHNKCPLLCAIFYHNVRMCMSTWAMLSFSEKWDVFAAIRRCCFGKTCFKIIAEKQRHQQQ